MSPKRPLEGKVCLVTGANSGIGREAVRGLAERGARVVMVCRHEARGEAARDAIRADLPEARLDLHLADVGVPADLDRLSRELHDRYERLDVLLNNAGLYAGRRERTAEGLEKTFAVNHMGYFRLTVRLLDLLEASAPARIINVASEAHRQGRLRMDDLQYEERFYFGYAVYAQSKLLNLLFTRELARRLAGTGVTANAVHPGVIRSGFWHGSSTLLSLFGRLAQPFMRSAESGARPLLRLATDPELKGVSGHYFDRMKRSHPRLPDAADRLARELWTRSEQIDAAGPSAAGQS